MAIFSVSVDDNTTTWFLLCILPPLLNLTFNFKLNISIQSWPNEAKRIWRQKWPFLEFQAGTLAHCCFFIYFSSVFNFSFFHTRSLFFFFIFLFQFPYFVFFILLFHFLYFVFFLFYLFNFFRCFSIKHALVYKLSGTSR